MARMPGTEWVGPHHDNGAMTRYDVVCNHTIVGNPPAHAAHFSTRADGHIYQSRDTAFASAANYEGNPRVIAIENDDTGDPFPSWDHNDGHAVPAFTSAQIEAIAQISAWAHRTHGVPLVACPNSRPTSRGIGYHRQGIPGNFLAEGYRYDGLVSGGETWTLSPGKVCPGDRRISQVPQIIARARVIAGLDQEDDLDATQDKLLKELHRVLVSGADVGSITDALGHAPKINQDLGFLGGKINTANAVLTTLQGSLTDTQATILAAIQADTNELIDVAALAAALRENLSDELLTELSKRLAS